MTQKGKSDKDNINRTAMTKEKRKYRILKEQESIKPKTKRKLWNYISKTCYKEVI